MGLSSVCRLWPIALALASLAGCAESPTPAYARPNPAPYGYPQGYAVAPAYGYGAMTCGNGPAMYSNAPGYGQSYPATPLRASQADPSLYGRSPRPYAPVYCPVGYTAGSAPYPASPSPAPQSPALWTFPAAGHAQAAGDAAPTFGSTSGSVTIYTSVGCGPCKNLQHKLSERNIPFLAIDVDQNRDAYLHAQVASGGKSGVPLTDINQGQQDVWILGDDIDAVEKAYRQN